MKRKETVRKLTYRTQDGIPSRSKYFKRNYMDGTIHRIVNKLRKFEIKITRVNKNNLEPNLVKGKLNMNPNCSNREVVYYAQTGSDIGIWTNEHAQTKRNSEIYFRIHCIENKRMVLADNIHLLS